MASSNYSYSELAAVASGVTPTNINNVETLKTLENNIQPVLHILYYTNNPTTVLTSLNFDSRLKRKLVYTPSIESTHDNGNLHELLDGESTITRSAGGFAITGDRYCSVKTYAYIKIDTAQTYYLKLEGSTSNKPRAKIYLNNFLVEDLINTTNVLPHQKGIYLKVGTYLLYIE